MLLLGLLPLWILVYEVVAAPRAIEAVGANPPAVAGLPVGLLLVGAALAIMAVGVVVIHRTSSPWSKLAAFVCLTVPAAVVMVAAPVLTLLAPL
jgi:hypothetical protein